MKRVWALLLVLLLLTGCTAKPQAIIPIETLTASRSPNTNTATPAPDTGQTPSPEIEPTATPTNTKGTQNMWYVCLTKAGSSLSIRNAPSPDAEKMGELIHGDPVQLASTQGDWAELSAGGFISAQYLSDECPDPLGLTDGTALLRVYKSQRQLELWLGDTLEASYPIGLGQSPEGHKQKEGDSKTPEGEYYICTRNPNSRFYLSLGVSYPGPKDAAAGLETGMIAQSEKQAIESAWQDGTRPPWNTALGGEIMVHGRGGQSDWTAGCIAVDDDVMDILWEKCPVGTRISIHP